MSPKRRTLLSLVFACICLSKSLLIVIVIVIVGKSWDFRNTDIEFENIEGFYCLNNYY